MSTVVAGKNKWVEANPEHFKNSADFQPIKFNSRVECYSVDQDGVRTYLGTFEPVDGAWMRIVTPSSP